MSAPPLPQTPAKPKVPFWAILVLILSVFLCVCAPNLLSFSMVMPFFQDMPAYAKRATLQVQMKRAGMALIIYSSDYDDVMPPREWVTPLGPYLRRPQADSTTESTGDSTSNRPRSYALVSPYAKGNEQDIALNEALVGKRLLDYGKTDQLIMLFVTTKPGKNPVGGQAELLTQPNLNVFGFADGSSRIIETNKLAALNWEPTK